MTGAKWQQRRSFWTWGYESDEPDAAARKLAAANISKRLGRVVTPPPIPRLEDVTLRDARLKVPAALQDWVRLVEDYDAFDALLSNYKFAGREMVIRRGKQLFPGPLTAHWET